jgi:hypothetical protein
MDGQTKGRTNGQINGQVDGRTDRHPDGWAEQPDEQTDRDREIFVFNIAMFLITYKPIGATNYLKRFEAQNCSIMTSGPVL